MITELQYDLTRKQRLIPHIKSWGITQLFVMFGFVGAISSAINGSWISGVALALLVVLVGRGYIIGLIGVIFTKSQHMDIRIEDKGLGFMVGKERWYIFLDGLTAIRDLEGSVWTIQHWNGTVVNIPKKLISEEVLRFLLDWVQRANDYRDQHGIKNPYPTKKPRHNKTMDRTS
jgi:hypothetical protein